MTEVKKFKCIKCKEEKILADNFYKSSKRKTGYQNTCKCCLKSYDKNRVKLNQYSKNYYQKNKQVRNKYHSDWKKKNYSKYILANRRYQKQYQLNRRKSIKIKLEIFMRSQIYRVIKNIKCNKFLKSNKYLGCTSLQLKEHLERQFKPGMSWLNYGRYGWHIDHIIPLSECKEESQIQRFMHFTNLQPLWAADNIRKGCKLIQ